MKLKKMQCGEFLHLYNIGVQIDFIKADLFLVSQYMDRRERWALRFAARLMAVAGRIMGRLLARHAGEVEQQATNLNNSENGQQQDKKQD